MQKSAEKSAASFAGYAQRNGPSKAPLLRAQVEVTEPGPERLTLRCNRPLNRESNDQSALGHRHFCLHGCGRVHIPWICPTSGSWSAGRSPEEQPARYSYRRSRLYQADLAQLQCLMLAWYWREA